MTLENRISAVEQLSEEYIAVTKAVSAVVRQQNEIYDALAVELAPSCKFEMQLRSAVSRAVWSNEEYSSLQDEWQQLCDRKDRIVKELEAHRWHLLAECTERAGGLPIVEMSTGNTQGAGH